MSYQFKGVIRNTSKGGNGEMILVDVTIDRNSIFFALVEATVQQGWAAAEWVSEPVVTKIDDRQEPVGD